MTGDNQRLHPRYDVISPQSFISEQMKMADVNGVFGILVAIV